MTLASRLRFLWLTLAVIFLDRATKAWIESRALGHFPHTVIQNSLYLVDSRNPGIAFSFLAGLSSPALRIILVAGSLIIISLITWLLVAGRGVSSLNAAGLALLLGGARQCYRPHPPRRRHRFSRGLFSLPSLANFQSLASLQCRRFRHHHRRNTRPS